MWITHLTILKSQFFFLSTNIVFVHANLGRLLDNRHAHLKMSLYVIVLYSYEFSLKQTDLKYALCLSYKGQSFCFVPAHSHRAGVWHVYFTTPSNFWGNSHSSYISLPFHTKRIRKPGSGWFFFFFLMVCLPTDRAKLDRIRCFSANGGSVVMCFCHRHLKKQTTVHRWLLQEGKMRKLSWNSILLFHFYLHDEIWVTFKQPCVFCLQCLSEATEERRCVSWKTLPSLCRLIASQIFAKASGPFCHVVAINTC